jgi:hypothetical protein
MRCITLASTEHSCNDYICPENYYNLVVYHHKLSLLNHECDVRKKYVFSSHLCNFAMEIFVIAFVPEHVGLCKVIKLGLQMKSTIHLLSLAKIYHVRLSNLSRSL